MNTVEHNSMEDKTILITGATDGVGQEVARRLAGQGARVVLHGRSEERGESVERELGERTGNDRLLYYNADLSSLAEVRHLGGALARDLDHLDVLINNAGIGIEGSTRQESQDGYELRFAVNYLSHFLLTHLLLDTLKASAPARIVNVASAGQSPIDFDDVMLEHGYSGVQAYCQSKLAQVMFTFDLAAGLEGSGVTVTALHPATYMNTKMVDSPISTVEDGAKAILNLAVGEETEGVTGAYYNQLNETRADAQAYDEGAGRKLRELSERLTGMSRHA